MRAPSADADRAVRYLTNYQTKSIAGTYTCDDDELQTEAAYEAHIDRLHEQAVAALHARVRERAAVRRPT